MNILFTFYLASDANISFSPSLITEKVSDHFFSNRKPSQLRNRRWFSFVRFNLSRLSGPPSEVGSSEIRERFITSIFPAVVSPNPVSLRNRFILQSDKKDGCLERRPLREAMYCNFVSPISDIFLLFVIVTTVVLLLICLRTRNQRLMRTYLCRNFWENQMSFFFIESEVNVTDLWKSIFQ